MNLWIFNHHALTPEQGGGTRHLDYARRLVADGHRVTIFASSFHYATHEDFKTYPPGTDFLKEEYDGVEFVWIRTRPYRGNGVARVLNMLDYLRKALRIAKKRMPDRPDIVVGSSVHLFAVLAGYRCARYYGVPFVMEVRDLWPQTLIDMGMSRRHPFIVLLGWLEKYLYRRADAVVTNLPYASGYIRRFVPEEKIHWIPNGVDLSRRTEIVPYSFEKGSFHVLYAGAVGRANQLDILIEAAKRLAGEPVRFHIVGDGPERGRLERLARELGVADAVTFHGAVDKTTAVSMINGADLLFFPLADSPVFRYGIASNKLFDYLASRRPVLFASNAKNDPVKEAGAGISVPAEDPAATAEAVRTFLKMPPEARERLGENGFAYVDARYDIGKLARRFEELLRTIRYNFTNSSH